MKRNAIFFASFMTLIAAGLGFAIRGGILRDWGNQYGFTQFELGAITGGGLVGFGIVILLASLITDHVGYKTILILAFLLHILSAIVTLAATPVYNAMGKEMTYWCLYVGMFMFAIANGLCEAVINPLTATLYPKQKTHYLNILHAGWPGGLVLGGIIGLCVVGSDALVIKQLPWEIPMALFLIPTLVYGVIVLFNKFPESEARAAGVSYGQMLLNFASPLLLFLLLLHACVGYVELGTDSWIVNITGSILTGQQGFWLFIYASSIMFILRFFAGPIVEKINPLGLLLVSAILGAAGLLFIGFSGFATAMARYPIEFVSAATIWVAMTIYAIGKTFFWPTMLGVVGERFPKGGAITMGCIGGVGMLSAGLLGGPGIGYKQDYYASQHLEKEAPATFKRYAANEANSFLFFPPVKGLDNAKVGVLLDSSEDGPGTELKNTVKLLEDDNRENEDIAKLNKWWQSAKAYESTDKKVVSETVVFGGSMALMVTALVPAFMAIGYLLLVIYFQLKGGYQVEVLHGKEPEGEHYTGGVEAPIE